ncbi:MAG: hypothetical protein NUV57_06390 [archaeon]|nr:hypothetical protein [archaeon]
MPVRHSTKTPNHPDLRESARHFEQTIDAAQEARKKKMERMKGLIVPHEGEKLHLPEYKPPLQLTEPDREKAQAEDMRKNRATERERTRNIAATEYKKMQEEMRRQDEMERKDAIRERMKGHELSYEDIPLTLPKPGLLKRSIWKVRGLFQRTKKPPVAPPTATPTTRPVTVNPAEPAIKVKTPTFGQRTRAIFQRRKENDSTQPRITLPAKSQRTRSATRVTNYLKGKAASAKKSLPKIKIRIPRKETRADAIKRKRKALDEFEADRNNNRGRVRLEKTKFENISFPVSKYNVSVRVLDDVETLQRAKPYLEDLLRKGENITIQPRDIDLIIQAKQWEHEIQRIQNTIEEIGRGKHDKALKDYAKQGVKVPIEKLRENMVYQNINQREKLIREMENRIRNTGLVKAIDEYNKGRLIWEIQER